MKRTIVIKVDPLRPDRKSISQAADIIKKGGLVAFPTETVYGLGANILDEKAIERLCKIKSRSRSKPFTVQISGINAIKDVWGCKLTKEASRLTDRFWPGPLTIILKSKEGGNIGFRMPRHKIALSLIRQSKVPICVPSANLSGNRPPTTAEDVLEELDGKIDLVIDGGPTDVGVESTVVDLTVKPAKILREGAISRFSLSKIIDL